jgi:mannose-1-phosphate guanylyltransferase
MNNQARKKAYLLQPDLEDEFPMNHLTLKKPTSLIVDDDRNTLRSMEYILTAANYNEMLVNRGSETERLWSIVLAGGEGERLRPFVQQWLGRHKPKQYCTFVGTRSMFQHTLDRADQLSAPDHRVTVIASSHGQEALSQLSQRQLGKLLVQPANRDTAAGIFLALTYVRAHDPQATVVLYPSDHFVYPEDRFIDVVRSAVQAAKHLKDWLFLLGVTPDRLEPEYGWIHPGPHLGWIGGHKLHAAKAFVEKPSIERCRVAMAAGALWNTLVLAARVETLWEIGWQSFPDMMPLFEMYGDAVGTSKERSVLEAIYEVMPSRSFSSDLLERLPNQVAVMELTDVLWSDWGRPERIVETLQRMGKRPAFAQAQVAVV